MIWRGLGMRSFTTIKIRTQNSSTLDGSRPQTARVSPLINAFSVEGALTQDNIDLWLLFSKVKGYLASADDMLVLCTWQRSGGCFGGSKLYRSSVEWVSWCSRITDLCIFSLSTTLSILSSWTFLTKLSVLNIHLCAHTIFLCTGGLFLTLSYNPICNKLKFYEDIYESSRLKYGLKYWVGKQLAWSVQCSEVCTPTPTT